MWHYSVDGNTLGPVSEIELGQFMLGGQVNGATMVWKAGMPGWLPLAHTTLANLLPVQSFSPKSIQPAFNPYQAPSSPHVFPGGPAPVLTWKQILWSFEGRIARRHYWGGMGIWVLVFMIVSFVTLALFRSSRSEVVLLPIALIAFFYVWSIFAIQAKRWHDRGMSGWMSLINLIPYIGAIIILIVCGCLRGDVGPNRFGQDPT